ncbi:uncharacterized protein LOC144105759 isoform X2 [Amblyomma americanum]
MEGQSMQNRNASRLPEPFFMLGPCGTNMQTDRQRNCKTLRAAFVAQDKWRRWYTSLFLHRILGNDVRGSSEVAPLLRW